jgi:hypothetical protein
MTKKVALGIVFILLEIAASVAAFYGLKELLELIGFPFTDNAMVGDIQLSVVYASISILLLILMVALNQRLTKELFNYKLAVPSLIIGALIAYFTIDFIRVYHIQYEPDSFNFLMLLITYTIPILLFNFGIRIQRKTR